MITGGTTEWFKLQVKLILRTAHAFDSLSSAHRYAKKLVDTIDQDEAVTAALHDAAIVAYGKAFLEQPEYPSRHLHDRENFDKELHSRLLDMRNKLVAHSDKAYVASELGTIDIGLDVSVADVKYIVRVPQACAIRLKTLHSIGSKPLAEALLSHIAAAVQGAHDDITAKCSEYLRLAAAHPDARPAGKEPSKAIFRSRMELSGGHVDIPQLQTILPAMTEPRISLESDGLIYRVLTMQVRMQGKTTVELPGGNTIELEISPAALPSADADADAENKT